MYIVVIAWLYVALMMAVAEATSPIGTVLGAIFTFLLYGLAPVSLVAYLMGAPGRRQRIREREAAEREAAIALHRSRGEAPSPQPDTGGEAPGDSVAPIREKP